MSSESVCQVARSWVDVGTFHTRLFGACTWRVAIFTMDQRKEQRVCIKFCASLGKSATKTLIVIQQAFGDQSLSRAQVFQWHARFKTGRTSVDDEENTGRPTSCTISETVARIQEFLGPFTTLLRRWELVMGHANRFWRKNWVCTVSQPNLCPGSWQLTRSSSASTSALNWTEKQNGCHPPPTYSPDLAPCDSFLFPKMKLKLIGRRFITIEKIQAESQRVLDTLTEKDFQEAFQKWSSQWDRCLHAGGNYFEGDGGR